MQNKLHKKPILTAVCAGLMTGATSLAGAAPLNIADQPLFVTNNVQPNIVLAVDDSGSMDSEVIFPTNDGALWWNRDRDSYIDGDGNLNFNENGGANSTWKKYVYLFPNGTGTGNRIYNDSSNDHFAIPPLPQFAYARSPAYNKAYFDPSTTYAPWVSYADSGTGNFGNIAPTGAISDPQRGGHHMNLTEDQCADANEFDFRVYEGMVLPEGTIVEDDVFDGRSTTVCENDDDNWVELTESQTINNLDGQEIAIAYFPATVYLPENEPAPEGFDGSTLEGTSPDGATRLVGYELKPSNFSDNNDYQKHIQNFANWYSYYRKRHLAVRGGIVRAFESVSEGRVGSCTINNRTNLSMRDLSNDADRLSFYETIYGYVSSGGTPNRQALDHLGDQLINNNTIIQQSCQQNFGILFTDGYAVTDTGSGVGNADGDDGEPFADNQSNTIADIARYYYESLATQGHPATFERGMVPISNACPDNELDCNSDLHMSTFGVTLGQKGEIFGTDAASAADPFANPPAWDSLDFSQRSASQIDDLWHATINSYGRMLNANTPNEVATQFAAALAEIQARAGSASSLSINTGTISNESRLYQASFRSGVWTGELNSRPISDGTGNSTCSDDDEVGDVCEPEWEAAELLDARTPDSRTILTRSAGGTGIPFRHDSLSGDSSSGQQSEITAAQLNYIRGDRSNEESQVGDNANPSFRDRLTVLGDIVNSSPAFVGPPDRLRYPINWDDKRTDGDDNTVEDQVSLPYRSGTAANDFLKTHANRTPMVYVGANDGMLHGFEASNGETNSGQERLAYVPSELIPELDELTDPAYNHRFYVDGNPVVVDAVINKGGSPQWRSVLVSNLGAGGRSVFALDVTDPSSFSENNAADTVLWEFTDADLGLTFSEPSILRLHNGVWAAVFGNGYNSPSGTAALYIVNLSNGNLIRKIDTLATPGNGNPSYSNGLGSVFPVDLDGDFITDYVYAGDLHGNIWQFDLTAQTAGGWGVGFGTDVAPEPLFTACEAAPCTADNRQPITSKPQVGMHPFGLDHGVMVYVGTGKYLESSDGVADTSAQHSFYGIWDVDVFSFQDNPPFNTEEKNGFNRSRLTSQSVLEEVSDSGNVFRVVTDNTVQYQQSADDASATQGGADKRGWVLDLPANSGEMVVTDASLRGDIVAFSTLIPSTAPCTVGGSGFFMVIDAATGGRTGFSALDVNGDRQFTADDTVTDSNDNEVAPSGVEILAGAPGRAGFALSRKTQSDIAEVPISNATIRRIDVNVGYPPDGRRSWRELRR